MYMYNVLLYQNINNRFHYREFDDDDEVEQRQFNSLYRLGMEINVSFDFYIRTSAKCLLFHFSAVALSVQSYVITDRVCAVFLLHGY